MNFSLIEKIAKIDISQLLTGQIMFREVGNKPTASQNYLVDRNLFSVLGIVALPVTFPIKGEHQYTISGIDSRSGEIIVGLDPTTKKNISDISVGNSPSGILKSPIWRI